MTKEQQSAAAEQKETQETQQGRSLRGPDDFERKLIEATQNEISQLRSEIYRLSARIARYDKAFETMFQEEMHWRLNYRQNPAQSNESYQLAMQNSGYGFGAVGGGLGSVGGETDR